MDRNKLIFLHLPKCGGTTLHSILERLYSSDETFTVRVTSNTQINTEDFHKLPESERDRINVLKGHFYFGLHKYMTSPSKYFTFLRDPQERILSYYHYVRRRPNHRLRETYGFTDTTSYLEFVSEIDEQDLHNGQTRWICGKDADEAEMLRIAKENIQQHFAFVGILELFDESLILLQEAFELPLLYYKAKNQTKGRPDLSTVDEEAREIVEEKNKGDRQLYEEFNNKLIKQITEDSLFNFKLKKLRLVNKLYANKLTFRTLRKVGFFD